MNTPADKTASAGLAIAAQSYRDVTGQSLAAWLTFALINLGTQAALYFNMAPNRETGEYGVLNAVLGVVGLLTIPAISLVTAYRLFFAQARAVRYDTLRDNWITILETLCWSWASLCFLLIFIPLPLPFLPRFSLQMLEFPLVLLSIGAMVSSATVRDSRATIRWMSLLISAAIVRLIASDVLTAYQPWAEAGLSAFILAGLITLGPALAPRDVDFWTRFRTFFAIADREFLVFFAATLSVQAGVYLFINADRIAAMNWLDTVPPMSRSIDDYQAVGLLARSILWGTQPLLWILYASRCNLEKTTAKSMKPFWIYLATLIVSSIALGLISHLLTRYIPLSGVLGPTFAAVMVPLGIIQALGIFSLASRRYPECFTLGGVSVIYALVLALFGRRPDLMLQFMFGASLIAIMVILFIGVVRWGRRQP